MPRLRSEYLFQLGRLCSLKPADVDALTYRDFANLIDNTDEWLKVEMKRGW
jgi:hypothetical protein